ncbi:MAG TPA: hypothetical protein VFT34_03840 [Verrucomicrobiae bacterium]|nr:hypothetical protein [Verrucomicrobiae bacterium]
MKVLLAMALLGLLAAAFVGERNAMDRLRAQNESLRAEKLEAGQLADENRDLPGLRAAADPAQRSDRTELLRLRNEVRRLRAQQQEAETLRAANQRVAEEIKSGKFTPRRLADMEGAVPREKWTFAGFATPEATVQSFLAAMVSGDLEQVMRCMPAEETERMKQQMAKDPESFRKEFLGGLDKFGKLTAFRITGRRSIDDDRMEILVQVVADGESMPLPLHRVGNEWKLGN